MKRKLDPDNPADWREIHNRQEDTRDIITALVLLALAMGVLLIITHLAQQP